MRHAAQLVQSVPFRWLIVLLAVLVAAFYSLESVDACEAAQHRLSSLTTAWTHEPLLVADLEKRVLPTAIPSFINGMAQKPDSLVVLVSMLCTAWKEDLGSGY